MRSSPNPDPNPNPDPYPNPNPKPNPNLNPHPNPNPNPNQVDIFSAGVVHYVALFYPHKPFFNQATQHQIMRMKPHDIRAETQQLEFPGKLSAEAQAFLRRTLNNNRQERPDVLTLLDDPYLARSK